MTQTAAELVRNEKLVCVSDYIRTQEIVIHQLAAEAYLASLDTRPFRETAAALYKLFEEIFRAPFGASVIREDIDRLRSELSSINRELVVVAEETDAHLRAAIAAWKKKCEIDAVTAKAGEPTANQGEMLPRPMDTGETEKVARERLVQHAMAMASQMSLNLEPAMALRTELLANVQTVPDRLVIRRECSEVVLDGTVYRVENYEDLRRFEFLLAAHRAGRVTSRPKMSEECGVSMVRLDVVRKRLPAALSAIIKADSAGEWLELPVLPPSNC